MVGPSLPVNTLSMTAAGSSDHTAGFPRLPVNRQFETETEPINWHHDTEHMSAKHT